MSGKIKTIKIMTDFLDVVAEVSIYIGIFLVSFGVFCLVTLSVLESCEDEENKKQ